MSSFTRTPKRWGKWIFVKGKVARITEGEDQTPVVRVELIEDGSKVVERSHDLVVLSVGMLPGYDPHAALWCPDCC